MKEKVQSINEMQYGSRSIFSVMRWRFWLTFLISMMWFLSIIIYLIVIAPEFDFYVNLLIIFGYSFLVFSINCIIWMSMMWRPISRADTRGISNPCSWWMGSRMFGDYGCSWCGPRLTQNTDRYDNENQAPQSAGYASRRYGPHSWGWDWCNSCQNKKNWRNGNEK